MSWSSVVFAACQRQLKQGRFCYEDLVKYELPTILRETSSCTANPTVSLRSALNNLKRKGYIHFKDNVGYIIIDDESETDESDSEEMGNIYIITSEAHKKNDEFKIGKWLGTTTTLIQRYRTYLPNIEILMFVECRDYTKHEKQLLHVLDKYRIRHAAGGKSEWVKINESQLLNIISSYFAN